MSGIKKNLIFFFLILFFVNIFGIYQYKEYKLEELKSNELENFSVHIEDEKEATKELVKLVSLFLFNDQLVLKTFDQFHLNDQNLQNKIIKSTHNKLQGSLEEFLKLFLLEIDIYQKNGEKILNFSTLNDSSSNKDNLSAIITYFKNNSETIQGLEVSEKNVGYSVLKPIFYNNEAIGVIKYIFSNKNMVQKIQKTFNNDVVTIIKLNQNKTEIIPNEYQEVYEKVPNLNQYIYEKYSESNNSKVLKTLNGLLSEDAMIIEKKLNTKQSFSHIVYANNEYRLIQFIPQESIQNGEVAGYYVSEVKNEYINELQSDFNIIVACLSLFIGLIFYFVYIRAVTQERLEEKNKELKNSLKLVDKYVILSRTDTNGIIEDVSTAFCEITGYTKEELIGQKHNIVRHPETPKEYFEEMWKTLGEDKIWNGTVKDRKKDGEKYWIKTYIEPIFNDSGKKIGYKNIAVDITDSKALEKINKNLKKRVKKAVKLNIEQYKARQEEHLQNIKLSSIGSLAAGITHEINTPLTYIKGNFEMMKYDILDLENNETLKENLLENHKRIYDGIIRISTIIAAMREIASGSQDDIKVPIDLYGSLFTSLTMLHNKAKLISRIYINGNLFDINMIEENSRNCLIFAHKQRIEQVWIVIINNALDELVKIDDYEDRKITIDFKETNDQVSVYFKDNAGGIDPKMLDRIFDPFTTSKESGGIGIGLSISKKIIEGNNGTIEAYNEVNQAVFKVTFKKYLE